MNQYLVGQGYWSYIIGAHENKPEITHANYPTWEQGARSKGRCEYGHYTLIFNTPRPRQQSSCRNLNPALQQRRTHRLNRTSRRNQRRYLLWRQRRIQNTHDKTPRTTFTRPTPRKIRKRRQSRQSYLRSLRQPPTPPQLSQASSTSSTTLNDLWIRLGMPCPTSVLCVDCLRRPSIQGRSGAEQTKDTHKLHLKGSRKEESVGCGSGTGNAGGKEHIQVLLGQSCTDCGLHLELDWREGVST